MQNMPETATIESHGVIEKCVQRACSQGLAAFQTDRRSRPRMPFLHPVRYCLGSAVTEDKTKPGYALDISCDGMGMCCQQGLSAGEQIWVRLPLADGKLVWVAGTVVYCEPDVEHYRAAVTFLNCGRNSS